MARFTPRAGSGSVFFGRQLIARHIMSEDTNQAPDGFCSLGQFDVSEADRLLQQFSEVGIRFQIDKIEGSVFTGGGLTRGAGYVRTTSIEIFVHQDDEEKATKIFRADWKV